MSGALGAGARGWAHLVALVALAAVAATWPARGVAQADGAAGPGSGGGWTRTPPPPPLAPGAPARAPVVRETRLSSGLRVVVVERHRRPVVAIRLVLPRGSLLDPPGQAGAVWLAVQLATDFYERTDQGEELAGEKSLRRQLVDLGGVPSVEVGPELSILGVTGYAQDARRHLALLGEAVSRPRRGEESFAARRNHLLDALEELETSDAGVLQRVVSEAAFGPGHPYARSVIGTLESLRSLGHEDVVAMQDGVLAPEGATLLVVGDVAAERALADARAAFRGWSGYGRRAAVPAAPVAPARRADVRFLRRQPASTLTVCATRPVTDAGAPDAALDVLGAILGRGAGSRLSGALREAAGDTYGAAAELVRYRHARALVACSALRADRADEALQRFRDVLARLRDAPPPPEELARAKALLLAELEQADDEAEALIGSWIDALALGLTAPRPAERREELARVTGEQVLKLARGLLAPETIRWILSGDPAAASRAVAANRLGTMATLTLGR